MTDENNRQIGELHERMDEPVTIHTFTGDWETCTECLEFNWVMEGTFSLLSIEEHGVQAARAGDAWSEFGMVATK